MADLYEDVLELLETMDELGLLLETETAALESNRVQSIGPLIDRKISLGQIFERQLAWLGERKPALRELDAEIRQEIVEASALFRERSTANLAALDASRRASERVMSLVIAGVRRMNEDRNGYGPSQSRVGTPGPLSVSLNARY